MLADRQIYWFLFLRLLTASLLLGGTVVYHHYGGRQQLSPFFLNALYFLIALTYLEAFASFFVAGKIKNSSVFLHAQITWDLVFSLGVIYITGGSDSPFSFLFIIVIICSSVFFPRKETFLVASAASIFYGSLVDLQYYGFLPYAEGYPFSGHLGIRDLFYTVFVNIVAFFLTALLSGMLAERLRKSESALRKKEVDYGELENLNRAIVSNIASGLLSINPLGRIRLFNGAAEAITGLKFHDVYNRDVREVFPELLVFADEMRVVRRGEARFPVASGEIKTLGYASSLLSDAQGGETGLLVSFQDLTELKEMELRLARIDRLAAVGQLASGMAHEIRNPLAAISGSVQLMLELKEFDDYEKRLMRIVIKEADRLSQLLTDFLQYARPRQPHVEGIDLLTLGTEIVAVANGDARFQNIALRVNCMPAVIVSADRQQLRQALWNLLINSAEAMSAGGTIWIGFKAVKGGGEVLVEDDGPGIPVEKRERIFDPFFSTKDRGTGLGLATVHAIVVAHGGEVKVEERAGGGTRFVLFFPGDDGNGLNRNRSWPKVAGEGS